MFQVVLMFVGVIVIIVHGMVQEGGLANVWRVADVGGRLDFFE